MNKKDKQCPSFKTKIGGQALIEGIMMRGVDKAAMAVRKKDGTIDVEQWTIPSGKWYQKTPFVRGVVNFLTQLKDGYKYISLSMDKSGMADLDEGEELSKFERWLQDTLGDKMMNLLMGIAMVAGVLLAVVLFMFVPTWIFTGISSLFAADISVFRSAFEGVFKIVIFTVYLWLTSKMKDIRRTYEYHGAEHKTIATYEAMQPLTVENVKKHSRFHPRCGTSFLFLVLFISIIVYSVLPINSEMFVAWFNVGGFVADLMRVIAKLLVLPLIVSISYEIIRLAGKYDTILFRAISAPGKWLQRLTTKEPDDAQIEVAIAALMPVIPEQKGADEW